jgi:uncharacterized protein YecT (DUF1311 family)
MARLRGIVLAALLAAPATAQDWNCSDIGALPQQGINACLAQRFSDWEAQMQTAYAVVLSRLPEEDEVRMRAGQLAWITYRDMTCEVEAGAMRGGSGEPMLRFGCLARITEARARELEELSR